jgi:agmatinase
VPAVIGPAPGGLDYWQMLDILQAAADKAKLCGFNLAELMPGADIGGRGALVAARIVAMVMGLTARQCR